MLLETYNFAFIAGLCWYDSWPDLVLYLMDHLREGDENHWNFEEQVGKVIRLREMNVRFHVIGFRRNSYWIKKEFIKYI